MTDLEKSELLVAELLDSLSTQGTRIEVYNHAEFPWLAGDPGLFRNTVQWLAEEGVVRALWHESSTMRDPVVGIVLTSLGFQLLSRKFKGELSLIDAAKEVRDGKASYANPDAGGFVGGILGGFTKSIMGTP
ncbi:hypothetical protein ACMA5I_02950 [Paracoccaceae bacterium GXU_MW_L88]